MSKKLELRCVKCGETLQSLLFYALAIWAGARSSFNPVACKHDFKKVAP